MSPLPLPVPVICWLGRFRLMSPVRVPGRSRSGCSGLDGLKGNDMAKLSGVTVEQRPDWGYIVTMICILVTCSAMWCGLLILLWTAPMATLVVFLVTGVGGILCPGSAASGLLPRRPRFRLPQSRHTGCCRPITACSGRSIDEVSNELADLVRLP